MEIDEGHPVMATTSEENAALPSPVDHGPMEINEQQPAMTFSSEEESPAKQKSLRQWTKQHKGTIGTILGLYFVGTFEPNSKCILIVTDHEDVC